MAPQRRHSDQSTRSSSLVIPDAMLQEPECNASCCADIILLGQLRRTQIHGHGIFAAASHLPPFADDDTSERRHTEHDMGLSPGQDSNDCRSSNDWTFVWDYERYLRPPILAYVKVSNSLTGKADPFRPHPDHQQHLYSPHATTNLPPSYLSPFRR